MSTTPGEWGPGRFRPDASERAIEAVARELAALLDEFEPEIRKGQVASAFAERLFRIRVTVEQLLARSCG